MCICAIGAFSNSLVSIAHKLRVVENTLYEDTQCNTKTFQLPDFSTKKKGNKQAGKGRKRRDFESERVGFGLAADGGRSNSGASCHCDIKP